MNHQLKNALLAVLFLFTSQSSFAILEYDWNDTLYVWADNGLNVRLEPSSTSMVVAKIPFGNHLIARGSKCELDYLERSELVQDKVETTSLKVNVLALNGNWVQVNYNGLVGYVFDAYLSKIAPPSMKEGEGSLLDFFAARCSYNYIERKDTLDEFGEDKIIFSNGIYMKQNYYPSGFSYRMMIPDFSEEEVFLLIRYIDDKAIGILRKGQSILIHQATESYQIRQFGNMVTVSWS